MTSRIPSSTDFARLSTGDQAAVLEIFNRQILFEIEGLKSGDIITDSRGRAYHLKNVRARYRRLEKLARDFGWSLESGG